MGFLWVVCATTFTAPNQVLAQEQAPPRELTGIVRSGDGRPILGATAILQTMAGEVIQQVSPEGSGRFVFTSLDGGIYYVSVTAPGYREQKERADLLSSRRVTLYFTMQPAVHTSPSDSAPGPVINQRLLRIPEPARREFEKGQQTLAVKKQPRESIPFFKKAIEKHAEFPEAYLLMGTAYMDLGEWKEARSQLGKAIELDGKLAEAHFALGTTSAHLGDLEGSEKALRAGLELEPQSLIGHWEIARLFWTIKKIPEAETHTRKTLELAPRLAAAHAMMGNVFLAKRDLAAALPEFKEYLRLEPQGSMAAAAEETIRKIEAALKKE